MRGAKYIQESGGKGQAVGSVHGEVSRGRVGRSITGKVTVSCPATRKNPSLQVKIF